MNENKIRTGFLIAGAYNLVAIFIFTLCFTDDTLANIDPTVFSWLGQVAICLWGLAYLAVSKRYQLVPALVAVFAVEKILYVVAWAKWLIENHEQLGNLNWIMQIFFCSYGLGDFAFAIFFAIVAWQSFKGHCN